MTVDTIVIPAVAAFTALASVNTARAQIPAYLGSKNPAAVPIAGAAWVVTDEQAAAAAQQIQSHLQDAGIAVDVRVDSKSQQQIITIRDSANGNVIRQIPGDQALWLAEHLSQGSSALVSETA